MTGHDYKFSANIKFWDIFFTFFISWEEIYSECSYDYTYISAQVHPTINKYDLNEEDKKDPNEMNDLDD